MVNLRFSIYKQNISFESNRFDTALVILYSAMLHHDPLPLAVSILLPVVNYKRDDITEADSCGRTAVVDCAIVSNAQSGDRERLSLVFAEVDVDGKEYDGDDDAEPGDRAEGHVAGDVHPDGTHLTQGAVSRGPVT